MPTLISADEFRDRFEIDSDIASNRIAPHIGSASRRLQKWVGATNYAAAVAGTADPAMISDFANAEAHLAFHFAILGLNSPLSTKGVVATARTGEGREMRTYLAPDDTAKLALNFLELAREIAEPYIADDPGIGFDIVTVDDPVLASNIASGGNEWLR